MCYLTTCGGKGLWLFPGFQTTESLHSPAAVLVKPRPSDNSSVSSGKQWKGQSKKLSSFLCSSFLIFLVYILKIWLTCSVKMKWLEKKKIKMSFLFNRNKYNFKPRNGQNNRFVLREAKWNKCGWFCTAILQASLEFFSELFFRYVETWYGRSSVWFLRLYSMETCVILVFICDDIMNVWVNKVISKINENTAISFYSWTTVLFLNSFPLVPLNMWVSRLGRC